MKKFMLMTALCSTMLLGGCATMGDISTPAGRDALIKQVQAITAQACGFIPIAATITAIVAAGQFVVAFDIANAICAAVAAQPRTSARSTRVPTVSGVPVRGSFVRR